MKITEFKEGDLITRTKRTKPHGKVMPMMFGSNDDVGDGSYIGDKLEYIGKDETKILVLRIKKDDTYSSDLDCIWWDDDGWDYYPHKLFAKAKKRVKELQSKYSKK